MNEYYSKREYNEMKNLLSKKIKALEKKNANLEAKVAELKKDYDVLLETATEESED